METTEQKAEEIIREHNISMDEPNFMTKLCLAMNAKYNGTKSETKNDIPAKEETLDRNKKFLVEKIKTFITDRGNVYEISVMIRYNGSKDIGEKLMKGIIVSDDRNTKIFDVNVNGKGRLLCVGKKVGVEIFNIPMNPMENESGREVVEELLMG